MKFTTKTRAMKKEFTAKFYFEKDNTESWVELCFLPQETLAEIEKKYKKTTVSIVRAKDTGKLEEFEKKTFDEVGRVDEWIDRLIVGWGGLYLDEKTLEPTTHNKIALFMGCDFDPGDKERNSTKVIDESLAFRLFVLEKNAELSEMAEEKFGGVSKEKNS